MKMDADIMIVWPEQEAKEEQRLTHFLFFYLIQKKMWLLASFIAFKSAFKKSLFLVKSQKWNHRNNIFKALDNDENKIHSNLRTTTTIVIYIFRHQSNACKMKNLFQCDLDDYISFRWILNLLLCQNYKKVKCKTWIEEVWKEDHVQPGCQVKALPEAFKDWSKQVSGVEERQCDQHLNETKQITRVYSCLKLVTSYY